MLSSRGLIQPARSLTEELLAALAAAAAATTGVQAGAAAREMTVLRVGGMGGTQLRVFALTYSAYAAVYFGRKPLSVTKAEIGLPPSVTGGMDTAFLAAYAFGQLCLGPLASRAGAPRGLALCYGGCALALLGFATIDSTLARTALWGVNGLFQSQCYPLCVRALAPHLDPSTRGRTMGVWTTSQAVGGVLANTFAAAAMRAWGWQAAFAPLPAALLAAAALLLLLGLPPEEPPAPATPGPAQPKPGGGEAAASSWVVARTPGLLGLCAAYFCVKLVRYTLLFWLPLYLHEHLGFTAPQAGFAATLFDVGAVGGSVLAGFLADRASSKEQVIVGMALAAAPLCVLLAATRDYAAPLMLLTGCAIAGPDALLGSIATQGCVERAGRPEYLTIALGLVNGAGSVGAILQGSCVTYLLHSPGGWVSVWDVCALLCLVSAAVLSVDLLKASPSKAAATLEMEAVPLLAEPAAHGDVEGGGGSAIHR